MLPDASGWAALAEEAMVGFGCSCTADLSSATRGTTTARNKLRKAALVCLFMMIPPQAPANCLAASFAMASCALRTSIVDYLPFFAHCKLLERLELDF